MTILDRTINLPDKKLTPELVKLFEQAAIAFHNFAEIWSEIRQKGQKAGFIEKELEEMLIPFLKAKGFTRHKIRYLFNSEEMKQSSKEQYLRNITQNEGLEQEVLKLQTRITELENLTPDQKIQLTTINEKIQKDIEEIVKNYKEIEEPWLQRKSDIALEWAKNLEIQYTILGKPLGIILKEIVFRMKFLDVAEGAIIYETIPDKYKVNYSKSQMLYDIYGDDIP